MNKIYKVNTLFQLKEFFAKAAIHKKYSMNILGYEFFDFPIKCYPAEKYYKNIYFFAKKGHVVLKYNIKADAISEITFFIGKDKMILIKHIGGNKYEYINAADESNEINLHKSFKTVFRNLLKIIY